MSIQVDILGNSSIIRLRGHIDASTATDLEKEVMAALETAKGPFIMDLKEVGYISSAGLRLFLIISKWSRAHHVDFCLTSVNDTVMNIFNISGFARLMHFYPTLEEALISQKTD